MVRIDFTIYKNFSACPNWWRNFISALKIKGSPSNASIDEMIDLGMSKFEGRCILHKNEEDVYYLEFDTEEDFNAFKIFWTLYGK